MRKQKKIHARPFGFLSIQCEKCGDIRGFNSRETLQYSRCKECDHKTFLTDLAPAIVKCKQVMSSIVNNGDYPVNIDLSLICKKRVAYMNLMSRLIRDGVFDKVNYDGAAIAEVNGILRENGFETACLGCFVESRRLQFQAWAETIVSEWNSEVEKRNPNAKHFGFAKGKMEALTDVDINALTAELESVKKNDQGNVNLGQGNSVTRMGRLLDALPSLQMKLTVEDLLTPEGLTELRKHDGSLFSIVKSRYGAASPKIVQDFKIGVSTTKTDDTYKAFAASIAVKKNATPVTEVLDISAVNEPVYFGASEFSGTVTVIEIKLEV